MLTAMRAADNILGANHNLWEVNEEQEYLEEIRMKPSEKVAWLGLIEKTFARMDKLGLATGLGSVLGLSAFLATIFLIVKGGPVVGPNLALLSQYFYGYTVTVKGAFIGFCYSFFWGFLFGYLFAYFRNFLIAFFIFRVRRRAALLKFKNFLDQY